MKQNNNQGIIYIMTTTVTGLIKIGKTRSDQYDERMRFLENNGYGNITGLKRFFAISVDQYGDKEKLLHEIFSKSRVGESELFALDPDLVNELMLAFAGEVVYPKNIDKEKEFEEVIETRRQGAMFNFFTRGIMKGEEITFKDDDSIVAKVVGEREVEYNGEIRKLSPLTREIYERKGKLNQSGTYQGAAYWKYKSKILKDIPENHTE